MVNGKLPEGWKRINIGEQLQIVRGISFPKDARIYEPKEGYIACLRTANVQQEVEWDDIWFVPEANVKRDSQIIQSNDILISTANSLQLVGKVAQVKSIPHKATLGAFISLIRVPNDINPKFIYFQLASPHIQAFIRSIASTTTNISNVSTGKLAEIDLGIPSLPEQERIVLKIEELFTQLDAGVAALKRVQAGLKHYKASVLKAAVEGRLVPQNELDGSAQELLNKISVERLAIKRGSKIRGKDLSKQKQAEIKDAPSVDNLLELPKGWVYARVEEIGRVQLGRQRSPKHHSGPHMFPYLRAANITWDGLELSSVMQMNFPPTDFASHQLAIGDVLLSEASGSPSEVGKPAVWRGEIDNCCFQNTIIRVRTEGPLPEYLYIHFLNDAITKRFTFIAKGIGIHHLGAERISIMTIAIPPLLEQRRIVAEVESRLSVIKVVENMIAASLARAERVRQAVLKLAFEGRLKVNYE